jgi:CubicO group peptidase (beta-lactamase class C family)
MKLKYLIWIIIFQLSYATSAQTLNTAKIEYFLRETYSNNVIPGFSVVIVKGDRVVFSGAYGYENKEKKIPFTCQSITGIGSITKSFTTLAIMQLSENGLIDLEAPVIHYLPWFRTANKERSDKITVRMLLNNTSGLKALTTPEHSLSDAALEKMVKALEGTYLSRDPGSSYEYSNTAFCVAGLIVQTVSGKSYNSYMNENILTPLQMNSTSFEPTERSRRTINQGHFYGITEAIPAMYESETESGEYIPAGSMASSCGNDMGNYLIALLNHGSFNGKQVISRQSLEKMWTSQISFPGVSKEDGGDGSDFSYGLGWMISQIDGRTVVHHGGSTGKTSSMTMIDTKNKLAVSVLMNIDLSFIDKYRYTNALTLANNILLMAAGEQLTTYGQPVKKDPTLNNYEINDSLSLKYTGEYFLLSGGDNIVFYNVTIHIGKSKDNRVKISIARNLQVVDEFKVDYISPVYAVSRNIGFADPIRFKLTPSHEVTGLIYRGMEFAKIKGKKTEKWNKIFAPDGNISMDLPSWWTAQWKNNKLTASDTKNTEISFTATIQEDVPADLAISVTKELASDNIVFKGLEHNESIAGRNWKEISLVTSDKQNTKQHFLAIAKYKKGSIILVFHTSGGKMTSAMQQYLNPLLYSLKF